MKRVLRLKEQKRLGPVDAALAGLLARLHPDLDSAGLAAVALTSQALADGHTCLPLEVLPDILADEAGGDWPDVPMLRAGLLASGAVGLAETAETPGQGTDAPDEGFPLLLNRHNHLALTRWRRAEERIAARLLALSAEELPVDESRARSLLDRLFPSSDPPDTPADLEAGPDLQKEAAALSLRRRLLLLQGGPGTGKTWTLARILALHWALSEAPPRIALAAPTGRAAMRLAESIQAAAATLPEDLFADMIASLPEPRTLHRLLGYLPQTGAFRRNANRPLDADLVVIDEASMMDSLMLHALLDALPPGARLILAGDSGQLPPVAPGSLLHAMESEELGVGSEELATCPPRPLGLFPEHGNLFRCPGKMQGGRGVRAPGPAACRVTLRRVRRFGQESGIHALAAALRDADPEAALARFFAQSWPDVTLLDSDDAAGLDACLTDLFFGLDRAATPRQALDALNAGRVLAALKEGPQGVSGLNARTRRVLRKRGGETAPCAGMPVLIQRNDYGLRLYNGDVGVLWPDESSGSLMAWFEDGEGGLRMLSPAALPDWLPAWAMTVHKAQGAEFARVLLVLPGPEAAANPLLTRELLYTAVTRAKESLVLRADAGFLARIASRRLRRHSGLATLLQAGRKASWAADRSEV